MMSSPSSKDGRLPFRSIAYDMPHSLFVFIEDEIVAYRIDVNDALSEDTISSNTFVCVAVTD